MADYGCCNNDDDTNAITAAESVLTQCEPCSSTLLRISADRHCQDQRRKDV